MNPAFEVSEIFGSLDLFCDVAIGQAGGVNTRSSSKRKHNTLSIKRKIEIIERLEEGESASDLADYYNVGRATIFDIRRKRQKIRKFASQFRGDTHLKVRKTMRGGKKLLARINKAIMNSAPPSASSSTETPGKKETSLGVNETAKSGAGTSSKTETAPTAKRKHNVLSLDEKLEVIRRLENGEAVHSLVSYYKIGRATVFDIKAKKESIVSYASQFQSSDAAKRRKTMRRANDASLEEAVYVWYKERTSNGQSTNGSLITEKALEVNRLLGGPEDFKASSGWLQNFKTRHGIRTFNPKNPRALTEKPSDEYSFLEAYLNWLQQEGYNRDDIYTADKMELNLKSMPRKTFFFQNESENTRKSLESVTIMKCANSSWAHSLPLLMIGKSTKEKCFKKVFCLPIIYRCQKDGVIDQDIFLEWYANEFISCVRKQKDTTGRTGKVLLLLHNAPYLPSTNALNVIDENFQVMFFPPNLSSIVHSVDTIILNKLRRMFKIQVLNRLLMTAGNEENIVKLSKRLTLKDFSYMLADIWSCLAEEKMKEMWKKLWGIVEEEEKNEPKSNERELKEVVEMCKSIPNLSRCDVEDVRAWLNDDNSNDLPEQVENTDEDAEVITPLPIEQIMKEQDDTINDTPQAIPTNQEAIKAFEIAIEWCERQTECHPEQLILLKRLKDAAGNKSLMEKKTN